MVRRGSERGRETAKQREKGEIGDKGEERGEKLNIKYDAWSTAGAATQYYTVFQVTGSLPGPAEVARLTVSRAWRMAGSLLDSS